MYYHCRCHENTSQANRSGETFVATVTQALDKKKKKTSTHTFNFEANFWFMKNNIPLWRCGSIPRGGNQNHFLHWHVLFRFPGCDIRHLLTKSRGNQWTHKPSKSDPNKNTFHIFFFVLAGGNTTDLTSVDQMCLPLYFSQSPKIDCTPHLWETSGSKTNVLKTQPWNIGNAHKWVSMTFSLKHHSFFFF